MVWARLQTPWSEITSFYQTELARHGWKLNGMTIDREWGKDLGGRTYIFCRDDVAAELEYASRDVRTWRYALSFVWTVNVNPCHSDKDQRATSRALSSSLPSAVVRGDESFDVLDD